MPDSIWMIGSSAILLRHNRNFSAHSRALFGHLRSVAVRLRLLKELVKVAINESEFTDL